MSPVLAELDLTIIDKEGVGRTNIAKSLALDWFPGTINALGFFKPESGRTDIHPAVIDIVRRRHNRDISDWPIRQLKKELIKNTTIVLILYGSPEHAIDYLTEVAFDVLLAPLHDPFGPNIVDNLETTATQLAFVNTLLHFALTQRLSDIGNNRDDNNRVIPRFLTDFESPATEPEYSVRRFLSYYKILRVSSSDPTEMNRPPEDYFPVMGQG